jgi:TusA-related sulfurtransferase
MTAKLDLDARGLSCPEPVIRTKKVLKLGSSSPITVLVDNKVAAENIKRLAKSLKFQCAIQEQDGDLLLTIKEV